MYKLLLTVGLVFAFGFSAFAQSSCSCSAPNGGCSSGQTCPANYVAVCGCSASGCTSSCSGAEMPEGITNAGLGSAFKTSNPVAISNYLSRAVGKKIVFFPTSSAKALNAKAVIALSANQWELFSYLASQGKFTINGANLAFWNGLRNTLLNGGAFKICAGGATAQNILNEINFLSGRRFKIVGGDPSLRMDGAVEGNNLKELVASLSMTRAVIISEN